MKTLPVVESDASLRIGIVSFSEGRVVEAIGLHSVELVIDITDKPR